MSAPPQLQHGDEDMLLTRGWVDEDRAPRTDAHLESKSETGKTPVVKYVRIHESNPRTAVIRIESNVGFAAHGAQRTMNRPFIMSTSGIHLRGQW